MTSFTLDQPQIFLGWLADLDDAGDADLSSISPAEMWSLVALAARGRVEQAPRLSVVGEPKSNTWRFAHAVGLEDAIGNRSGPIAGEEGRTVRISRVVVEEQIGPVAREIAQLLLPGGARESERKTIQYVLVELVRNVLQHSDDPRGAVVGAQVNAKGRNAEQPVVQVAVADTGRGVKSSLLRHHPELKDAREALQKSLWPHYSGAFPEGRSGNLENAGLGLFVIAEMAKAVEGRFLLASRRAALVIEPAPAEQTRHRLRFLETPAGFPGTLVAFEIPETLDADYESLFAKILALAKQRTPQRITRGLLRFGEPPPDATRFAIQAVSEDVSRARQLAETGIESALMKGTPVVLDFLNVPSCTQSFAHALLFEAVRLAWARRCTLYVVNAQPAVRSALEMVENYALGG